MEFYSGKVYKYISIKGALESLAMATLKFTKSTELNDPFECFERLIRIEDYKAYAAHVAKGEMFRYPYSEQIRKSRQYHNLLIQKGDEYFFSENRSKIFVCSLSKTNTSSIMWSHYADSHRGICIEYENIDRFIRANSTAYPVFEVDYVSKINPFILTPDNKAVLMDWATTKSVDWIHEQEVRLIEIGPFSDPFILPKHERSAIKKITFGLNTSDEDIATIMELMDTYYHGQQVEFTEIVFDDEYFTITEVPYEP